MRSAVKEFEQDNAILHVTTADLNKMATELEFHYKSLKYRANVSRGYEKPISLIDSMDLRFNLSC